MPLCASKYPGWSVFLAARVNTVPAAYGVTSLDLADHMGQHLRPVAAKIRQVQPAYIPLPLKPGELALGKMPGIPL